MRVLIKQSYTDRIVGKTVHKGEELTVSEQRAQRLIKSGVAEIVNEDSGAGRIAELEAENKTLKEEIAALKKK